MVLPSSTSLPQSVAVRPVHLWNPPLCGDSEMVILRDGTWLHQGAPIPRPAMAQLFSSLLRKDGADYVLVTPAEKLTIRVEDLPFCAVELAVTGDGVTQVLRLRTNLDVWIQVNADHPLQFDRADSEGLKPRVRVRADLWARVTRAVAYDLLQLVDTREGVTGVWSAGVYFPLAVQEDDVGLAT